MRKLILLLLAFLLILPSGLFASDDMEDKYPDLVPEPYDPSEYPSWAKKTRRAVVVFAGSYPLSIFFTKLGFDLYDWGYHNFSSDYSPSIVGGGGSRSRGMDTDEMRRVSIAALPTVPQPSTIALTFGAAPRPETNLPQPPFMLIIA